MSTVTPTLTLPQPTLSSALSAKPAAAAAPTPATAAPLAAPASSTPAPSTTVSFSPQGMAASHSSFAPASSSGTPPAAPVALSQDGSVYESLKSGISTAVGDVGDAIAGGAHAVVEGVETALSTANKVVKGTLELPFAAVSKAADAVGALIDEL